MRRSLAVIPWMLLACAHAQKRAPVPAQPLVSACEARGGQACRELGWMALRGPPSAGADRSAARRFMEGCETKDAQSCADLGALYAVGRGVRKDDARACALGLADACARAGLPAPSPPRTPTAPVEPSAIAPEGAAHVDAKEAAAAIDRAESYARYFIDRDLHERTRRDARRSRSGAAVAGGRAPARESPRHAAPLDGVRLPARRHLPEPERGCGECVADLRSRRGRPHTLGPGGPRVQGRLRGRSGTLHRRRGHALGVSGAACRRARLDARRWNGSSAGGPSRAPGCTTTPSYATAGYTRPAMREPGCVQRHIRVPSPPSRRCCRLQVRGRSSWRYGPVSGRGADGHPARARSRRGGRGPVLPLDPRRRSGGPSRPDLGDSTDPVQVILARRQPRPPRVTTASTNSASPIVSSSRSFSLRVTNR